MTMKLIETNKRENCVFCCSESLLEEFSEKTPIFAGVTEDNENFFVESVWGKCVDCETIQLLTLVPSEILYNDSHSPGTVGSMWDRHHREFKEFILKNIELNCFLEIGAGSFKLFNLLREDKEDLEYTIIDPNISDHAEVNVVSDFLENYKITKKFDNVIHSHTFEHFYNPLKEFQRIQSLMHNKSKMIMSIPLTHNQLMDGYHNALNLEHTFSINLNSIFKLLDSVEMEVDDVKMFNKHCVFVCASKKRKFTYNDYAQKKLNDIKNLNKKTKDSVFLFGAHVFSQSLLFSGLDLDVIGILDNDPNKIGKRLYGTDLTVFHPNKIKKYDSPIVVVRAAQYTKEITQQLKTINPNVVIL